MVEMHAEFARPCRITSASRETDILILAVYLVENGRASMLLKTNYKRKRTKEELEEVKDEEDALRQDSQSYYFPGGEAHQAKHAEMMAFL